MIKTEMGNVELSGSDPEIVADLSSVIRAVREHITKTSDAAFADFQIDLAMRLSKNFESDKTESKEKTEKPNRALIASIVLAALGGVFDD